MRGLFWVLFANWARLLHFFWRYANLTETVNHFAFWIPAVEITPSYTYNNVFCFNWRGINILHCNFPCFAKRTKYTTVCKISWEVVHIHIYSMVFLLHRFLWGLFDVYPQQVIVLPTFKKKFTPTLHLFSNPFLTWKRTKTNACMYLGNVIPKKNFKYQTLAAGGF